MKHSAEAMQTSQNIHLVEELERERDNKPRTRTSNPAFQSLHRLSQALQLEQPVMVMSDA